MRDKIECITISGSCRETDMLSEKPRMKAGNFEVVRRWLLVLAVTLAFFYCMDQVLMSAQGLPLGWSLAPQN